jgi:hypothetical protein
VTVAVPDLVVSAVEVALTVSDERVSAAAMVSRPLALTVVPEFLPVSTIDHVTVVAGLLVPATVAANACVPPLATLAVAGFTVTPVTVGVGGLGGVPPVMVTVAEPYFVVSAVEVALTVSDVRVSAAATVSRPLVLTVVPEFLPVSTIDHVTVCAGLLVPFTVAVNACVPLLATLAVAGFTVTPVTVGVSVKLYPLSATSGSSQAINARHTPTNKKKPSFIFTFASKTNYLFAENMWKKQRKDKLLFINVTISYER